MRIQVHRRLLLTVGLVLLAGAGAAPAADLSWSAPSDGLFWSGANWDLGYVPNFDDVAIFDQLGANQTVSLNPYLDTANERLLIESGSWRFDLSGRSYVLTDPEAFWPTIKSFVMGLVPDSSWLYVEDGTFEMQHGVIGFAEGSSGYLQIDPSAHLDIAGTMEVGWFGAGSLWLQGSSAMIDKLRVGAGATGSATVWLWSGASLQVNGSGASELGGYGMGGLWSHLSTVSFAADVELGNQSDSYGWLDVSGAGASIEIDGALRVGNGGEGVVDVFEGGYLNCASASVAMALGSPGNASVRQQDSLWEIDGNLDVGFDGEVTIEAGSTVDVGGTATIYTGGSISNSGTFRAASFWNDGSFTREAGSVTEITNDDLAFRTNEPLGSYVAVIENELIIGGSWDISESAGWGTLDAWGGDASCGGDAYVGRMSGQSGQIWAGSTSDDSDISVGGSLYLGGDANGPGGYGEVHMESGSHLDVGDALVVWGDGSLTQGVASSTTASSLEIAGGAVDNLGGEMVIGDAAQTIGFPRFHVHGTDVASVLVHDGGTLRTSNSMIASVNGATGEVTVSGSGSSWQAGSIDLGHADGVVVHAALHVEDSGWVQSATDVMIYANGVLDLDGASLQAQHVVNHAVIKGEGGIHATVVNFGQMAPGHSTGQIEINGLLTMKPGCSFEVELAGQFDSDYLLVNSDVTLEGGTIHVTTIDGYEPEVGHQHQVLGTLTSLSGAFDGVEPADRYALVHTSDSVLIEVLAPPCGADLDGSAHVGFDDLAVLLGSWGPCAGACPADIDSSGHVGFDDLAILLGSWGVCP